MVFVGIIVINGSVVCVVIDMGMNIEIGKI